MKEKRQDIQYFLFSQYLSDGIRTTLEIILPSVIFAQFHRLDLGLIMSTGALCASMADGPGPVEHKRNGMLYCILFTFLMTLVTGLVNTNIILMGLLVLVSSFFFTMFSVFGNRAASLGTAALLIMVLRMDRISTPLNVLLESLLVVAGGFWYLLTALLFFRLYPYRPSQRLLGICLHETARYLKIKSALYESSSNISDEYRKLVAQQVVVNEKQDELRELLYKNREMMKDPTDTGKLLMVTFADVVDLFENIMATWYDYALLRERFGNTGLLNDVSIIIQNLADEIDRMGLAIQSNNSYKTQYLLLPALNELKAKIDGLEDNGNSHLVLKKILVNIRNLGERTDELMNYFKAGSAEKKPVRTDTDYARFVSHQVISSREFFSNFTLQSSVFRHSLRMMITCITGFIIAKLLPNAHHGYWILLTIIVILKPGFSLTKQRNLERLFGTVAGGIIGVLFIYFIHDRDVLFSLIIIFMLVTYTFIRVNYVVTVIFMTPYIIILFNLLGIGSVAVAEERLLDTAIASVLAFAGSYFLFPHWESVQLENYMISVLKANRDYLQQLLSFFSGKKPSAIEYKLVRKQLYISSANLSAAFQRMLSEPKSKQRSSQHIYEFVVLNHVLSSNIASLTASMINKEVEPVCSKEIVLPVKKSITILKQSLQQLDHTAEEEEITIPKTITSAANQTDKQLTEQLNFIYKVSGDIGKITTEISKQND
ncbi:FUSC family membrane protein [Ferruginibacter paludis]|uniref:FUSC family protein n=1 Tax=Ferruginibacter paludis TaxID=1310417 RepID=UPI0025B3D4AC|nr:FUSC family membrane protein [Ferruginibacter paludis]MDN3656963.1 FUSC family membrane protein [Ferruginibacter paludis]